VSADDDCGYSAVFFEALAGLAKSLAGNELAIYEASFDYLCFGSWSLVVGTSHRRLRFAFDGKEGWLEVFESEFQNQGSQSQWRPQTRQQVGPWSFANPSKQFALVQSLASGTFRA
jgi:hypothetical protein